MPNAEWSVTVPLADLVGLLFAHYGERWSDELGDNAGAGEFDPSRLVMAAIDADRDAHHAWQRANEAPAVYSGPGDAG